MFIFAQVSGNSLQWKDWSPPDGKKSCGWGQVGETCFSLNPLLCLLKFGTLEMRHLPPKNKLKFLTK